MTKKRRTRAQKVKASGFAVSFEAIERTNKTKVVEKKNQEEINYFRSDLTKVAILTMLALALEFALWRYLPR